MVIPIAAGAETDLLTLLRRQGDEISTKTIAPCRFVPLVGDEGF